MARRKQNVDAYGKSWSPIDIPNLEKAVRLYERLNYLQDHFAGSLSNSNKIWDQINEKAEIKEELERMNIKLTEDQIKKVLELFRIRQQENALAEKSNQIIDRGTLVANNGQYKNTTNLNGMFNGFIGNAGQRYINRRLDNDAADTLASARRSAGQMVRYGHFEKNSAQYNQYINETASKKMEGAAQKYETGANLIQVAADTFSKAVQTFGGLFTKGLSKQAQIYEDTFTNISVRTGTTRSQYFQNQIGTASTLYSKGLAGNIATSEVQQMWDKLASNGMDQEAMFTRALDNVLTNKIVPYLDTSSQSLNILNERVDGKFIRDIRGINRINNEIAGNNYTTQEMLQTLIDEMQPMSDAAVEELAQGSAEVTSMINSMIESGWSADAAKSYATQLFKAQKYGDQIMRSGSVTEKKTLVDAIGNGVNIYDPTQFNDYMALAAGNTSFFANMGPGYKSTLGGVIQNAIGSAVGEDYARQMGALNGKKSAAQIKLETDTTKEKVQQEAQKATADYTNNINNTLKQIQENELENLSTWLAAIYEQVGYWGDIIAVAIKGLAGIFGTKLLGGLLKGGSSGLGLTGIGAGLANGFAKGAPKALGAGKIGAFTGTAGAVAGAVGVAGGAAMAVKGGMDIYNDLNSGEGWTGKTTASAVGVAGGVAGAGALLALGASNPIGWVALAIGGAALLGRSLYESATNYEKAGKKVEQEFNQVAQRLDQEQIKREENLLKIKDNLKQTSDVEKARNDLIALGVLSAEDEKKWRDMSTEELKNNKNALIELTNQYIKSTKDFSNAEQELLEQIKNDKVKDANEAAKSIKTWFEDVYKGNGGNTDANNEVAKNLIMNMASTLEAKGESNWSDDEKKFMERYRKNSRENKFGYDDLRWILEGGGSWWGISNAVMDNTTDLLTNTGFALYANNRGAHIKGYKDIDMNMLPYATEILQATSKEEAEEAVKKAKEAGMVYSEWKKYIGSTLIKYGIPSFRSGLSYVPYDDYLANLHEGEAVITAATANELRNLITTYRNSQQTSVNLDAAIQNQTIALVNKIDEVISVVQNNNSVFSSTKKLNEGVNIFNNMKYLRSTKSFNSK